MYSVQTDQRRLKRDCTPNNPYCKSLDRPILKPRPVKTNCLTVIYVCMFMFMCVCLWWKTSVCESALSCLNKNIHCVIKILNGFDSDIQNCPDKQAYIDR